MFESLKRQIAGMDIGIYIRRIDVGLLFKGFLRGHWRVAVEFCRVVRPSHSGFGVCLLAFEAGPALLVEPTGASGRLV